MAINEIARQLSFVGPSLDKRSQYLRRLTIDALKGGGRGHIGSTMSLIEIIRVLYDDILNYRSDDPEWSERDCFILSKGHGCLALYVVLADKDFFPLSELETFCRAGSMLGGQSMPPRKPNPSVTGTVTFVVSIS